MFVTTLIAQPHAAFLTRLDLSNQPLDRNNIAPFSEIMSIEFGMRELVLDGCGLEDSAIKILMHSLLENDKIKQLSLANNPKISTTGFKYIAVYVKGSSQLTTLNLSYTQPDKKAIEYLMNAIVKSTPDSTRPFLSCLVLDNCNLRVAQLEVLAAGIKKPTCLRQLFISHQRMLNQQGALSIGVMLRDYDTTVYHGLQRLCLDHSPMNSNGIQYITQALRRNQSLRYLSMQDCNIDSASCYLLAEALKYNQFLEKLDLACNALCKPTMEGMTHITQALTINRSLKDFCLAETKIFTEAIIILAECLAENNTLIRLDLSRNPDIQMAALMALAASVRRNDTITFIDIHVPTQDKEMVSIHNDILSKCTKNAQTRKSDKSVRSDNPIYATTAQATARLTLKERLAAVTGAKKPIHDDAALIQQALEHITSLEGSNPSANILYASQQTLSNISTRIPEVVDPSQLDILLTMNDRLTLAIERYTYKE
ncbi:uncharacterized protein B0P05DRAFT_564433 [Gilbertella persicaria]|uniref:uncharacterized protein n=1 Tax=Gilbertella persicaria TaxID=101096 RepID=UPI002220D727|nr:uncharacterized protein B0P05DRAFT_564433 [Gilbertella persicaria]KAI8048317.1 hypothetical protein B0P05DRAFT_564433 [Gilbertella persicaria]